MMYVFAFVEVNSFFYIFLPFFYVFFYFQPWTRLESRVLPGSIHHTGNSNGNSNGNSLTNNSNSRQKRQAEGGSTYFTVSQIHLGRCCIA
jgi:hypothetical protein